MRIYVSDVSSASVSGYRDFVQSPLISPVYVITCQQLLGFNLISLELK